MPIIGCVRDTYTTTGGRNSKIRIGRKYFDNVRNHRQKHYLT
ncbi:hypothetical protein LINPERPRIM_LOCUS2067, partial [Linum perenne]